MAYAPMTPACKTTPAFVAHWQRSSQSASETKRLCRKYGKPIKPLAMPASPSLCAGCGCSYIYESNQGGGWAWIDGYAIPYSSYGFVTAGTAYFGWYNKRTGNSGVRADAVVRNDGLGWHGYWQIHPTYGWVETNMNGSTLVSSGYSCYIGPVVTWNYITS